MCVCGKKFKLIQKLQKREKKRKNCFLGEKQTVMYMCHMHYILEKNLTWTAIGNYFASLSFSFFNSCISTLANYIVFIMEIETPFGSKNTQRII